MKSPFKTLSYVYIGLSLISLLYVAALAWFNPEGVMALVGVDLPNTDALSSIRGVYGGVGFSLVALFTYLGITKLKAAIFFLAFFWGLYAVSRAITYWVDGPLGDFSTQWIIVESTLSVLGAILYVALRKKPVS